MATSVAAASGQTTPAPSFVERLAESRYPLSVDRRGLDGPGAKVLADAVHEARYVLVGEDHLSREIPIFTTQLCRAMAPGGLDAFAVEIGPAAASVVNAAARRPDRADRIAAFMRDHPDAMAFQNGRDESEMAAACAVAAGPRFRMWGLDQEFFGAAGLLLERMLAANPGPVARAAIVRLAADDGLATRAALASGSPAQLLVYAATDRQLADTRAAIAKDGGARAAALFAALENTRAIYLSQNTDAYASNGARARLMKRTLATYLRGAPAGAHVLFKFGDAHMGKGVNSLGERDLGNFVAERADGEGARSLHLLVVGQRGVHALYNGVGRQARTEPFVLRDDPDFAWMRDAVPQPGAEAGAWTLLDLRPLRSRRPREMSAAWRRLVDGFDLVVIAPELTPSSLLGAR